MSINDLSRLEREYLKNKCNYIVLINKFNSDNNYASLNEIFRAAIEIDSINGADVMFHKLVKSDKNTSESIKIMMDLGVNQNIYSFALYYCFINKDIEFAKYLFEKFIFDVNDFSFDVLSLYQYDYPELVKLLIDNDLILSKNSCKLLSIFSIVKLFLDSNVDLNEIFRYINPNVDTNIISLLIDEIKKSNVTIEKEYLNKFLLVFYERKNLSLDQIKTLINAGADARINNDYPFVTACFHGDIDTIKYFLYDCCSNINAQDSNALAHAIYAEHFNIAKFLIESGIKITDKVIKECLCCIETIPLLLNAGINLDYVGKILWSTMQNYAMQDKYLSSMENNFCEYLPYMKELAKYGVDFNKIILS